jgi:hypothetical protein
VAYSTRPSGRLRHDVLGQTDGLAARRLLQQALAGVDLVGLPQDLSADRVALGGEEREAHRAADDQRIDGVQQGLDHAQLVG